MPKAPLARLVLAAALVAAVAPSARAGVYRPDLSLSLGRTFSVGSNVDGAFDQGGFALTAGALWPWEGRFRFGAQFVASDFGDLVLPVSLADPSGGPPKDYGEISYGHRAAYGAAWRVDAVLPNLGSAGSPYVTGTYGYFRYRQDRVGEPLGALSAVGGSLGIGFERAMTSHHTLGLSMSQTWMSEDLTRRYASASLEWRWHW